MMAGVKLYTYQEEALDRMKDGCILNGSVGSGKSRTGLAYYYTQYGGEVNCTSYRQMVAPIDLYIITTARKRDTLEWEGELIPFGLSTDPTRNRYNIKVTVDSWNNIGKYVDVKDAFFIFDEQRLVGYGAWSKTFIKISRSNRWILLSATPGDTWTDYLTVFIANNFFKNKSDFCRRHVVWSRFTKYPKIERFLNQGSLIKMKRDILVNMDYSRKTTPVHEHLITEYDKDEYDFINTQRWNIYKNKPIENAGELCFTLRRLVNSDFTRKKAVLDILEKHPKAIIFYSYDYELEILRELLSDYKYAEWNGHKHEPVPQGDAWAYLVEYTAGSEGWNCITTDTIIFYSQNYSYKVMKQASGRIDRLNTPYSILYYYHLRSNSKIDIAIRAALRKKKKFNESGFVKQFDPQPVVVQTRLSI